MAKKTAIAADDNGNNDDDQSLRVPPTMRPEIVQFKITGISPLLQNNPAEFIGKEEDDTITTGKKVYNDEEEARLRVYKDADGNFVHPAESFIKSAVRAVTGKKFGKVSAPARLKGSVFLAEPFCIIEGSDGKPAKQYTIDKRSVVINKKARVPRCRPCWPNWKMTLNLELDTALIARSQVLDALNMAGRIIGIGDYRPEKGGGFGRFKAE